MIHHILLLFIITSCLCICKGGCPFGFDKPKEERSLQGITQTLRGELKSSYHHQQRHIDRKIGIRGSLASYMTCSKGAILTTVYLTENDYDDVVYDIRLVYDNLPSTCINNNCPQADFAGCVVRLAGHDLMDYDATKSQSEHGGSDGCIDFDDADNNGLEDCTTSDNDGNGNLNGVYEVYCDRISLADFVVIAAEAVMGHTSSDSNLGDQFKAVFRYGRTTSTSCSWAIGRLPDPEKGCQDSSSSNDLESVFVQNIFGNSGLSTSDAWKLTAAISGAHTLGKAEISNSGYNGFWGSASNSRIFNNDYFKSIVFKGWAPEKSINGNNAKNQWKRSDIGVTAHKEMMLDSDMCLAFSQIKSASQPLTTGKGCCAWIDPVKARNIAGYGPSEFFSMDFCGTILNNYNDISGQPGGWREKCCDNDLTLRTDCDSPLPEAPAGVTTTHVQSFARNELTWLTAFRQAWEIAVTNGYDSNQLFDFNVYSSPTSLPTSMPTYPTSAPTTNPPTSSPSSVPTNTPTVRPQRKMVGFNMRQSIIGVSKTEFTNNSGAIDSFIISVEETLGNGCTLRGVTVDDEGSTFNDKWDGTDDSSTRRLTSSIDISYSIVIILGNGNAYSDTQGSDAYTDTKTSLTASLSSGAFATTFQNKLQNVGLGALSSLLQVPSDAPITGDYNMVDIDDSGDVVPDDDDDSQDKPNNVSQFIIGGAVAAVVVVLSYTFFYFYRQNKGAKVSQGGFAIHVLATERDAQADSITL